MAQEARSRVLERDGTPVLGGQLGALLVDENRGALLPRRQSSVVGQASVEDGIQD